MAAHGDADVGARQGRRVVDAVARHGHDLAPRLELLDQGELAWSGLTRLRIASGDEPELAADGLRGGALIAGEHDGANAGLAARARSRP